TTSPRARTRRSTRPRASVVPAASTRPPTPATARSRHRIAATTRAGATPPSAQFNPASTDHQTAPTARPPASPQTRPPVAVARRAATALAISRLTNVSSHQPLVVDPLVPHTTTGRRPGNKFDVPPP